MSSSSFMSNCVLRSLKIGTTLSVTVVMTPKQPSPTDAYESSSELLPLVASTSVPLASSISRPTTAVEMEPSSRPVPCVPVWMAPATDWAAVAPKLRKANPSSSSMALRSLRRVPAWTLTSTLESKLASEMAMMPERASSEMSREEPSSSAIPFVSAIDENEWPAPTVFTLEYLLEDKAEASSETSVALRVVEGEHVCSRSQEVHVASDVEEDEAEVVKKRRDRMGKKEECMVWKKTDDRTIRGKDGRRLCVPLFPIELTRST
mmetsp:Transcript_21148/g.42160  ORF Transcript_21148/g.42160 Transcript_21148/m.42160 type:complete len:263 (-) Transcript_21148:66-854(-)